MVIYPVDIYTLSVRWYTVIVMLIMTCIIDLKMHVIDFMNTFYQAKQRWTPVYMACFHLDEMDSYEVLLLNKSLQGQDEAPMLLFEKLKYGLEEQNLEPSDYDPCMFVDVHLSSASPVLLANQRQPEKATWSFLFSLYLSERLVPI